MSLGIGNSKLLFVFYKHVAEIYHLVVFLRYYTAEIKYNVFVKHFLFRRTKQKKKNCKCLILICKYLNCYAYNLLLSF